MAKARINRPDKSAMQSGKVSMDHWVLEFAPEKPYFVDNLMGWVGMTDTPQEIHLKFPTKEAAVSYAKARAIPFDIFEPNKRKTVRKAYADNFKFGRVTG